MSRLDFNEDGTDWEFLINVTWPHEGIKVGFDIFPSDEEVDYNEVRVYLFLINFIFVWG